MDGFRFWLAASTIPEQNTTCLSLVVDRNDAPILTPSKVQNSPAATFSTITDLTHNTTRLTRSEKSGYHSVSQYGLYFVTFTGRPDTYTGSRSSLLVGVCNGNHLSTATAYRKHGFAADSYAKRS